jgi:hypothetical protein
LGVGVAWEVVVSQLLASLEGLFLTVSLEKLVIVGELGVGAVGVGFWVTGFGEAESSSRPELEHSRGAVYRLDVPLPAISFRNNKPINVLEKKGSEPVDLRRS